MWGSLGMNSGKMKELVKKYGRTGLVTYLSLSTMVTTGARGVVVFCAAAACAVCVCVYVRRRWCAGAADREWRRRRRRGADDGCGRHTRAPLHSNETKNTKRLLRRDREERRREEARRHQGCVGAVCCARCVCAFLCVLCVQQRSFVHHTTTQQNNNK